MCTKINTILLEPKHVIKDLQSDLEVEGKAIDTTHCIVFISLFSILLSLNSAKEITDALCTAPSVSIDRIREKKSFLEKIPL